jgi:hypothetical protein
MNFKKRKLKKVYKKEKSEWCKGGGTWLSDLYGKALKLQTRNQDDVRFKRFLSKYVRCKICNKRLHPKVRFELWYYEFNGIFLPHHKAK